MHLIQTAAYRNGWCITSAAAGKLGGCWSPFVEKFQGSRAVAGCQVRKWLCAVKNPRWLVSLQFIAKSVCKEPVKVFLFFLSQVDI